MRSAARQGRAGPFRISVAASVRGSGASSTATGPTSAAAAIAANTAGQPTTSESASAPAPAISPPTRQPSCVAAAPAPCSSSARSSMRIASSTMSWLADSTATPTASAATA